MAFFRSYGLILVGIMAGSFFFFPWNDVRDQITSVVQKNAGITVQMQSLSPTTGLKMGLAKGSLLAFSATKASVRLPMGQTLFCHELVVGPRFWPFLIGQAQVSLGCFSEDGGSLAALVSASPFWGPKSISQSAELTNFSMANISMQKSVHGVFSGSLDIADINTKGGGIPTVNWDLKGRAVRTPEVSFPGMSLPELDVDLMSTNGSLSARAIKLDTLNFGSPNTLIEGKLKFQSDINENFAPQTGELSGTLRIDPGAERGSLSNVVSWKTVFGPGDDKGHRQFKRPFNNGIQSLFLTAYNPNLPQ